MGRDIADSSDESERAELDIPTDAAHGFLRLQVDQEQFADFISSLLGGSQSLTGRAVGEFRVSRAQIMQLITTLSQRIRQQNDGVPIRFSVTVVYDDGYKISLSNLDEFATYNEVRDLRTVQLLIGLDYIIVFPSKQSPERQRIELTFAAPLRSSAGGRNRPKVWQGWRDEELNVGYISDGRGLAKYEIDYTDRTWALDISNIANGFLESIQIERTPFVLWLRRHWETIYLLSAVAVFVTTILVLHFFMAPWLIDRSGGGLEPEHIVTSGDLRAVVNVLILEFALFVMFATVSFTIWGKIVGSSPSDQSTILWTERDMATVGSEEKSFRMALVRFVAAAALAFTINILSAIAFYYLIQR